MASFTEKLDKDALEFFNEVRCRERRELTPLIARLTETSFARARRCAPSHAREVGLQEEVLRAGDCVPQRVLARGW